MSEQHSSQDPYMLGKGTGLDYDTFVRAASGGPSIPFEPFKNPDYASGASAPDTGFTQLQGSLGRIGLGVEAPNGEMVYSPAYLHLSDPLHVEQ